MTPPAFHWPVRVYYEDTDAAGIVYHASYLKFMERARTEWLRWRGFDQRVLCRDHGVLFAVVQLEIRYCAPARLDDELRVNVNVHRARSASFHMRQDILRGAATVICEANVRVGCLDAGGLKARRIPPFLLAELQRED